MLGWGLAVLEVENIFFGGGRLHVLLKHVGAKVGKAGVPHAAKASWGPRSFSVGHCGRKKVLTGGLAMHVIQC